MRAVMRITAALAMLVAVLCVAAPAEATTPRIELTYFKIRGRAEVVRLMLEFLGLPYTDRRFQNREEWLAIKDSGRFAFNQVPALRYCPDRNTEEGCQDLVQTHTILRFLARKYDAYLDDDKRVYVDMLTDGVEDFRSRLGKLVYSADGQDKIAEHLETTVPQWLGYFERLKGNIDGGKNKFFVADTITHGDLYLFLVLEAHVRLGGLGILSDFPLLQGFWNEVSAHGAVDNWRVSRRRLPLSNGESASLDSPKNPPPFNDFGEPWPVEEKSEL